MDLKKLTGKVSFVSYPRIIVICGPTRTGTTALSHTFIRAGLESHMQPIKSILRALEDNHEAPIWRLNGNPDRTILTKETMGAKHDSEYFNPIEILVDLGYPPDLILPILMVRDPAQTFSSWQELWGDFSGNRFIQAYHQMMLIRHYCDQHGIRYLSFVHESIRANPADLVTGQVFKFCQVEHSPREVIDWHQAPKFGDDDPGNAHLYFYDEPPEKFIAGVRNWGGYTFRERPVSDEALAFVAANDGLSLVYSTFAGHCERDLSITI